MTLEALKLLKHIRGAGPEPYPVTWGYEGLEELRELGFVDLYDMGPRGEARWTITTEGRSALNRQDHRSGAL